MINVWIREQRVVVFRSHKFEEDFSPSIPRGKNNVFSHFCGFQRPLGKQRHSETKQSCLEDRKDLAPSQEN